MKIPSDLILVTPIDDISGVAETGRCLYEALLNLGVKVKIVPVNGWSNIKIKLPPELQEKIDMGLSRNDVQPIAAIHMLSCGFNTPLLTINEAKVQVSWNVFETKECPRFWATRLAANKYVENWVPAKFLEDGWKNNPTIEKSVRLVPFGVDNNRFRPGLEPIKISQIEKAKESGAKPFVFLTAMDWGFRKNPEAMIVAFMKEFSNDPNAFLVVKAYTDAADEKSKELIRQRITNLRMMTMSKANVILVTDFIDYELMPHFHSLGNAWVNTSFGEGWDMGSLQSMACGIPVVGADNSAHRDYLNSENGYPIKCSEKKILDQFFLAKAPQFDGQSWWEPELQSIQQKMRQAYTDYTENDGAVYKAKAEAARIRANELTWENAAGKALIQLGKFFQG